MGSFAGAFVFDSQPDWKRLAQLPPDIEFRAYLNSDDDYCLLDMWIGEHDYPFVDAHEYTQYEKLPTDKTIEHFSKLSKILESDAQNGSYGLEWLRLTAAVSRALGVPTHFAAADDEFYEFACLFDGNGTLQKMTCLLEPYLVRYDGDQWVVSPRNIVVDVDDEQIDWSKEVIEKAAKVSNTVVTPAGKVDPFNQGKLHEWWPAELPEVDDILELEIDDELEVVYERVLV